MLPELLCGFEFVFGKDDGGAGGEDLTVEFATGDCGGTGNEVDDPDGGWSGSGGFSEDELTAFAGDAGSREEHGGFSGLAKGGKDGLCKAFDAGMDDESVDGNVC